MAPRAGLAAVCEERDGVRRGACSAGGAGGGGGGGGGEGCGMAEAGRQ